MRKRPAPASDETIIQVSRRVVHPAPRRTGKYVALGAGIGLVIVILAFGIGWAVWSGLGSVQTSVSQSGPSPMVPSVLSIEAATIEHIRRHESIDVSFIRLAENPHIVVVDFASLVRQGSMLDRVAALIEKADLPRDRILNAGELARAVKAGGDMEGGFYYGHDYSAASLTQFFAVVDRDHIHLSPEEAMLRRLLNELGWSKPGVVAGLISLPRVGADRKITVAARDVILTHELAHGEYFSNPEYAAYVHQFFLTVMTEAEREGFRGFLVHDGNDIGNPQLVENETQAYLVFTPDPRFIMPSQVKMTQDRRAQLRSMFLLDMSAGWLRDVLAGIL